MPVPVPVPVHAVCQQDTYTFDKIVGAERPTFVRFDQEYPVLATPYVLHLQGHSSRSYLTHAFGLPERVTDFLYFSYSMAKSIMCLRH